MTNDNVLDELQLEIVDTKLKLLVDLAGSHVIPMTVEQFLGIEHHVGEFTSLTINGINLDLEIPHLDPDGPICTFFYKTETGEYSDKLTMDGEIQVHTNNPVLVLMRLGEWAAHVGTFSKTFPEKSNYRTWPNTELDITAQVTINNGSFGDGDYSLIPMSFKEFLALEKKMRDVKALIIRGSSIDTGDGIHGFSLGTDPNHPDTWKAWYPSGQITEITPEHIVKVVTLYPDSIITQLSNLRLGK